MNKKTYDAAIDWGNYTKGKLVVFDGKEARKLTERLDVCMPQLAECGVRSLVIEASYASFDLRERVAILDAGKKCEVEIGVIPTKQTEKYRREHGLEDDKSDELDARCIFEIANNTNCHVAKAKYPSDEQLAKQDARRSTPEGRALVLRSLDWATGCDEFLQYLPDVAPGWLKETYFWEAKPTKKDPNRGQFKANWCIPVIAAAIAVIQSGGGREEFDRKIGYYAFGYPSFLRSNFYYGMVRYSVKKRLGVRTSKELASLDRETVKQTRGEESRKHRRAARWIFSRVKFKLRKGPSDPAMAGLFHPNAA